MSDKFCEYCRKLIERGSPQYYKKRFCNESHKQMAHRKKKDLNPRQQNRLNVRLKNLSVNKEWLYISQQCKRAGSVQIMSHHTVASLKQLIGIICNKPKTRNDRNMDICHVYPVKGSDRIGLLHPLNLVYGESDQNKKNGTKIFQSAGYSIDRVELKNKWRVTEKMKDKTILRLLEKFLGNVIVEYAKKYPVKISGRVKLIDKIIKLDKTGQYTRDNLSALESIGLSSVHAELHGVILSGFYFLPKKNRSRVLIYLEELSRVAEDADGDWAKNCEFMYQIFLAGAAALSKAPDQPELLDIYKAHGKKADRYKHRAAAKTECNT
ncbi:hypothetical protein [Pseudomonas sp. MF6776]|uniref:hypothetical protein n=1 Tax=Pseudomonas sp. MF6776 TaxID=2797534 RepID=UPI00190D25FA|nr:hypothetical protein [Pseudomonas sp. MF6776]MBK3468989.1 hypothetical protein [Pseudomonas sp. MF6776]